MTEYMIVWDSGVPEGGIYRDLDKAKEARHAILREHGEYMRDFCHIVTIGSYVDLGEIPYEEDHPPALNGCYTDGYGNDYGWQDSTFPNEY